TPMPIADPPPELAALRPNFRGYALGLDVRDYRGRKALMHTGGLPGYVSRVMMIPEERLRIADHYLGAPPMDWIDAYEKVMARLKNSTVTAEDKTASARNTASKPSLP